MRIWWRGSILINAAVLHHTEHPLSAAITTIGAQAIELQPYFPIKRPTDSRHIWPSHGGIHPSAFAAPTAPPCGTSLLRLRRDRNSFGPRGRPAQRNRAGVKSESAVGSLSTEPLLWSQTADLKELLERVAVGQRRRFQDISNQLVLFTPSSGDFL